MSGDDFADKNDMVASDSPRLEFKFATASVSKRESIFLGRFSFAIELGEFVGVASGTPPMMAIALDKGHYSVKCIRYSKCFTIAFPSLDMAHAALFFGSRSGRDSDKFAQFDCETKPAKKIDSLLLTDAVANFECKLQSRTVAGDHIIFVGKVVAAHINTKHKKRLYSLTPNHKFRPSTEPRP